MECNPEWYETLGDMCRVALRGAPGDVQELMEWLSAGLAIEDKRYFWRWLNENDQLTAMRMKLAKSQQAIA
ncbi:MAG: hypothetical protein AAGD25_18985 [Cyanobacteria bacterium P01_F01_bin.150]